MIFVVINIMPQVLSAEFSL